MEYFKVKLTPSKQLNDPRNGVFRRISDDWRLDEPSAGRNSMVSLKLSVSGSFSVVMVQAEKSISTSCPVELNTIGRNDRLVELQMADAPRGNRIDSGHGRSMISIVGYAEAVPCWDLSTNFMFSPL